VGSLRSWEALGTALVVFALFSMSGGEATSALAQREVLPNGVVLLVSQRPAVPIVAVRVYVRGAGAAFDPPDRQGLANLTGTLLSRGTAKRNATELDAAIEFVGGSLETGADRDGLMVAVDVLRKDLLLGLDLLSEVLLTPAFAPDELTRKVKEIQAAIQRIEESPEGLAARALRRLVFAPHPYGWPVEGTRESVAKLTHPDVAGFYRGRVRPDTTVIAVVGAVSVDDARREILARFGRWARPVAAPSDLPLATAGGPARTEAIKRELAQSTILMGRQAIRQTDPDYFALAVASYVLGGGSSSRVYGRVREQEGLAYSVWSDVAPARYGAWLTVGSQTRAAAAGKAIDLLHDELARMGREPVSDRELELAKAFLIGSFPLRLDTTAKVANFIVATEVQGLGLDYADRYRQGIARVTTADVQRVSARLFAPDTLSRVVVGPIP
jgi:zinc protease